MQTKTESIESDDLNPLSLLMQLALTQGWQAQRQGEHDLAVYVTDPVFPFAFLAVWNEYLDKTLSGHLEIRGLMGQKIPHAKKVEVFEILNALNANLDYGSFLWCARDNQPLFQYRLLATKTSPIRLEHLHLVTESALVGAEKLRQAWQFLFEEGRPIKDVIWGAFLEVAGEA